MEGLLADLDPLIVRSVDRMRNLATISGRDTAMLNVKMVREGKFSEVWPGQFSDAYPTSIVANFVDVACRDIASNLAPMPSLACSAGAMRTNADKTRAEKKNRIGSNYWRQSQLDVMMTTGADQYLSYGFLPFWIEPDYDRKTPVIHVEDPEGAYYELDRWGNTVRYAKVTTSDLGELAAQFGDAIKIALLTDPDGRGGRQAVKMQEVEVVRFTDKTTTTMYCPTRNNTVLASYPHKMPFCPIRIAERPGLGGVPRGQFDDVLWVQMAHAVMAQLTLEAGHKAVQAPIIIPTDVVEFNVGPDAVMQTDNGDKVHRVPLQVPTEAFQLGQQLQEEMNSGAGYPTTRQGDPGKSNVTGRGISALEGGFDSQISLGQAVLGLALREVTKMCFRMDAVLWPKTPKTIRGTLSGETYEITYRPGVDLADDVECEVTYGFAAGSSPGNAIVTLLQLSAAKIIGPDTFRRQLPFDVNIDEEQRQLDIANIEDSMMAGLAAALTSVGQLMASGQATTANQIIQAAATIAAGRRKGESIIDLYVKAFPPPPPPPAPAAPGMPDPNAPPGAAGPDGAPDGAEPTPGVQQSGLPQGVAPGQAGMAPGGRPSIANLAAGFSAGGAANMSDTIQHKLPI